MTTAQADLLTTTSQETLNQYHLAKPLSRSWILTQKLYEIVVFHLALRSFGMLHSAAVDNPIAIDSSSGSIRWTRFIPELPGAQRTVEDKE